jgi:curli biogenesis system outer membrane secretion channel CsgG
MRKIIVGLLTIAIASTSFAQKKVEKQQAQIQTTKNEDHSLKRKVAISRFTNETTYAKGIFFDKENNNPIEKQAADMLATKLASSGKFFLLERQDLDKILEEVKLAGGSGDVQKIGADYLILGSVTEFGRKTIGDNKVLSRTKTQVVNVGVSLRLVDVSTGEIVYSEEGKGEASAVAKTVMGYGETADFDATLNDKAISSAISKLVENIINNCMNRPWKSYILSYDESGIFISGGQSQGLKLNDNFAVFEKGKSIKNPQTGVNIELPGKMVGKIKIDFLGGENPQSEYAMVSFIEGDINKLNLNNYIIKELTK